MREKIQSKAVEQIIKNNGHGLLNLAPRVGKTKIAIDWLKSNSFNKILWVAPSSEIRDTDVPEEFKKWNAENLLDKVTLVHWASLNKEVCEKFDCIILDEYQMISENNAKTLKGKCILGLSGTHPTEEEKLLILKKLNLKIIYRLSIDEAVKHGIVSPYKINIVEYNLNAKDRNVLSSNKKFKTTELQSYNYASRLINQIRFSGKEVPFFLYLNRQKLLHNFPSRQIVAKKILETLKGRTLIFSSTIEQAESLCEFSYHSKTSDDNYLKFQSEKINRLSLVNMASVGTTFRNMDNCLLVGTNSKAKNFEQKFCRILLPRDNYIAQVYIICAINTRDEDWVKEAVSNLDPKNINYINFKNV